MASPLVSILIPSYNRPDYLEMALRSALAQTYKNIEIIISDDSTNFQVRDRLVPYLSTHSNIKYIKNKKKLFVKNWIRCFAASSGSYINYLMDDDLFHPQKIEEMMSMFMRFNDVSLVTSYRQLIDEKNEPRPGLQASRIFNQLSAVPGAALGNYILTNGRNVVGEPTTVLFRKEALTEPFGVYHGKQYVFNNDLATWISLLSKGKAVYIPQELSSFRIHSGQNQHVPSIIGTSFMEWTDLIVESRKDGFLRDPLQYRSALYTQLQNMRLFLQQPRYTPFQQNIQQVMQRIKLLLSKIE
ncbi:glycosyltransferase family 2 protein [Ferviditalea candida]|uniref:Glycosyltransferase n=1 Tax=Ferviditalea candida TaxID=3108399 RepID=A0ABU5ZD56_9BACL|nr:glycosyltransferase [Paenibacillaceae bacterium T2]